MTQPLDRHGAALPELRCRGHRGGRFCEACGTALTPIAAPADDQPDELESPIELTQSLHPKIDPEVEDTIPIARPCTNCGGVVGADGYCETCGTKALSERDHYTEQPAPWVAACCDRGIRHYRNEDATALAADPAPGSRAVLVVCDGVSTSLDSDVASLAAARRARDVLVASKPAGIGTPASRAGAIAASLEDAAAEANAAVVANTAADSENAASCTFAAAVLEGDLIVFGNVGDSRVYWIPDAGSAEAPAELSVDDSVAQARIAMGVAREEAENGPQAHAITKWLGRDSPDFVPRTGSITAVGPGWLLVCSDGLWNYVSEASDLQTVGQRAEPRRREAAAAGRRTGGVGQRPGRQGQHLRRARPGRPAAALSRTSDAYCSDSRPEGKLIMAEFSATVYQNEFLPDGGTDVNAIVTVTCSGAGSAGQSGSGDAGEIIIVDTSGSMGRTKLEAAKTAASAAIDQILDGTCSPWWPAPIRPTWPSRRYAPAPAWSGWTRAPGTPRTRRSPSSAPTAEPRWAPG